MSQDEPPISAAEIRQRAYELWERNRRPNGLEIEFWVTAERELRAELRRPARNEAPNRAYGVRVSVPGRSDLADVPVLVHAADEQDAMILAAEVAGPKAQAEVFRELTEAEVREHGLDLAERGRVTALPILAL